MNKVFKFLDDTFLDLGRQFKWTYLPPLMVYVAAGISGLTGIVGTFFVKDYLNLSAAFLAGLGFWAGIPWALKMPLGHLVDLIWERKVISNVYDSMSTASISVDNNIAVVVVVLGVVILVIVVVIVFVVLVVASPLILSLPIITILITVSIIISDLIIDIIIISMIIDNSISL